MSSAPLHAAGTSFESSYKQNPYFSNESSKASGWWRDPCYASPLISNQPPSKSLYPNDLSYKVHRSEDQTSPRSKGKKKIKLLQEVRIKLQSIGISSRIQQTISALFKLSQERPFPPEKWAEFGKWSLAWHKFYNRPLFDGHPVYLSDLMHEVAPAPRPKEWPLPRNGFACPLPNELILNPLLEHTRRGWPPMSCFINLPWIRLMYAGARHVYDGFFPVPDSDLAQAATRPLVKQMLISAIADDVSPRLLWPIHVYNPIGINVGDVVAAIYETFQKHMTRDEYVELSPRRQDQIQRAYWARINEPLNGGDICPGPDDGLRRIDYLGDNILFRGLEPARDGEDHWTMYIGPP